MFGPRGEPRLLLLILIDDYDFKGYELIKAIEEMAGGDCALSPGVACLTLALLGHLANAPIEAEG
jgi:DNA-binding PadR family transcriptional regulator